ncbi:MAG: hypothetical protein ACKVK5_10740 [Pseudomonadales bacterium]
MKTKKLNTDETMDNEEIKARSIAVKEAFAEKIPTWASEDSDTKRLRFTIYSLCALVYFSAITATGHPHSINIGLISGELKSPFIFYISIAILLLFNMAWFWVAARQTVRQDMAKSTIEILTTASKTVLQSYIYKKLAKRDFDMGILNHYAITNTPPYTATSEIQESYIESSQPNDLAIKGRIKSFCDEPSHFKHLDINHSNGRITHTYNLYPTAAELKLVQIIGINILFKKADLIFRYFAPIITGTLALGFCLRLTIDSIPL